MPLQKDTELMFGDVFVHHTVIHADGFRSLNTGEQLEFTVIQKEGKWHATSVTGPNGSHVEGLSKLYQMIIVGPELTIMYFCKVMQK